MLFGRRMPDVSHLHVLCVFSYSSVFRATSANSGNSPRAAVGKSREDCGDALLLLACSAVSRTLLRRRVLQLCIRNTPLINGRCACIRDRVSKHTIDSLSSTSAEVFLFTKTHEREVKKCYDICTAHQVCEELS